MNTITFLATFLVFSLCSVEAQGMSSPVTNHAGIFDAPPKKTPTQLMPDGPLLGNGDVGVVLGGSADQQLFCIAKNDFWCLERPHILPVGTLKLLIPALQDASYHQEQDLAHAEVRGTFTKGDLSVSTRSWVDATHNVLVTEMTEHGSQPVSVALSQIIGGLPRPPKVVPPNAASSKPNAAVSPVTQNKPKPGSDVELRDLDSQAGWVRFTRRSDKPEIQGHHVSVFTRIIGAATQSSDHETLDFDLKPDRPVLLVTTIVTNLDAPDYQVTAKSQAMQFDAQNISVLNVQHRAWWSDFWSRSSVEIPDKLIEKYWYGAMYILGSCSREGRVAPGLWGNWITVDFPAFSGDYTLNYNFEAPYYIAYSSNHAELTKPYYKAIQDMVPKGLESARKNGWKGVNFPTHFGPGGVFTEPNRDGGWNDWGQRSDAAYAALNFISYYNHTQDKEWLKTVGYPYLIEVANFWDDYLAFQNGRYVIYNDAVHEGSWGDFNGVLSLGLVRTLYKSMLAYSKELNIDANRRAKWEDILTHLSDYPLQERNGKTVFRYTEKGMPWNGGNGLGIQQIFPAGAIGLDSDPKLLNISRNMIAEMRRWGDTNCFSSFYTAAARVGYNPEEILQQLHKEVIRSGSPNLIFLYGGGGIENVSGFLAINEMLFQSYEGVLRFFPCWPKNQDARFTTLRACGAFLVSAELKNGAVGNVTIFSEKGKDCCVANPWPGRMVKLTRNRKLAETLQGDRFTFPTSPNETLTLNP